MSTFDDDSDDLIETNSSQAVEEQDSDEAEVLEKAPKTWPKKKRAGNKPKAEKEGGKRKKPLMLGNTLKFNHDEIRKALAKMLIVDEFPFAFVEREGFRQFCKVVVPEFVPPSRATITRDCYGLFIDQRKMLKKIFNNLSSRVIGKSVEKCLLEWNLKRVMIVTVDNASSNDLAIKYLKKIFNLWDGCVLNYEFLHMRCAAHILNFVVKDGLKDVNVSVFKVRAAVKYVRSCPSRLQKFKSCVEEENITCKCLICLNIETRWNSTYLMLKTALVFRKAFKNMKTKFSPYTKELIKQPVGGCSR
uniref:Uncharacterized protein n=1 Tax=Chenopodium quinoa TaxID=63459 RepID=A0A803MMN0_CHEQI